MSRPSSRKWRFTSSQAPREVIHNRAVNVGDNAQNYQVKDIGDQVKRLIPSAKVVYTGEVGADPRNYRVRFDLLNRLLPGFKLQYDLASGMEDGMNRSYRALDEVLKTMS
jgi:nucleoside-diphosphate-sugar epimerase